MAKDVLPFVFLDIAIVIVVARLMGRLFVRLRQPAVIGEILGGIVLGPSVLGLLPGNLPQLLFPADVRPHLTVIAQLGLVLFMFIVGLEVDLRLIQSRRRVATTVSLSSIALPFGLGAALAVVLYPAHSVAGPDAHTVPAARVRAVPRRRDVDHRVPGAGADPHRTRHAPHPGRRAGAGLRRRSTTSWRGRCWPSSSPSRWAARWRASARSCCSPRCSRW